MKDFFISYTKADRSWAEWIAWQLEEAKYAVVIQAWDFRPGTNFVESMQQAASEAERTIAVLSSDYLNSRFSQPEWQAAFAQDPTGEKGILLPVRTKVCDLKGLLPQIVYIDLVGLQETEAKATLLTGVQRGRAKPEQKPDFPGTPPRVVLERPRFPGVLPPIWNILHNRNPNFTGRDALLTELHEQLNSGQAAALTQAINGLGGVGKTQLAVEYAYRQASDYTVVWWIRSEESATLATDYANLAGQLDLPDKNASDQRIIVEAVRRWLEHNSGWLLIFDNVREAADLKDYRPRSATGHVIVTSRNPNWRGVANPLTVKVLEREAAIDFLCQRTGQDDRTSAGELTDELGHLPLALEQAAAYIEAKGKLLAAYMMLFREHKCELLRRGKPSTEYPDTVATTWELSFQEVQQASPAAADLLNLCAFLAPDEIPLSLFIFNANVLPEPLATAVTDPISLDDIIDVLRRYSLIEVSNETLTLHRLVQAVVRDRLTEEKRKTWVEAAVRLVNDAFPYRENDVNSWAASALLLPHALQATQHAQATNIALEETSRLLNQIGLYLRMRAQFTEAQECLNQALSIAEEVYGLEHPTVAIRVNNLGLALWDLGDAARARVQFERALTIGEKVDGYEHQTVAMYANNLGLAMHDLGDMAGAYEQFARALKIDEVFYGPEHPQVAVAANNLVPCLINS